MKNIFTIVMMSLIFPALVQATTLKKFNAERGPYKLPALPYKTSALVPAIDEQTMSLHHGKHHQAYVDKLNGALSKNDMKLSLLDILKSTQKYPMAVRNNAGGHWNHSFFWTVLIPNSDVNQISKSLKEKIDQDFGSFDKLKEQFESQALGLFGSGWVWLIVNNEGRLQIISTINQDNPLMDVATVKGKPILALDVWEHAYYLNYQNKRADYIKAFWSIVNWKQVSNYYSEKL